LGRATIVIPRIELTLQNALAKRQQMQSREKKAGREKLPAERPWYSHESRVDHPGAQTPNLEI
jgi:hypothetical protein